MTDSLGPVTVVMSTTVRWRGQRALYLLRRRSHCVYSVCHAPVLLRFVRRGARVQTSRVGEVFNMCGKNASDLHQTCGDLQRA
jgi:hypothetical protein